MKTHRKLFPNDINRFAFRAYFEEIKRTDNDPASVAYREYFREAARYLLNVQHANHRLGMSDVSNGLQHVRIKLVMRNDDKLKKQCYADAEQLLRWRFGLEHTIGADL
ncbi:hypothetical protein ACXWTF_12720 [Thiomicrolovo sp. ZZH C-3]